MPDISVKAVGLNCGAYDGKAMATGGENGLFLSYLDGIEKKVSPENLERIDAKNYMTKNFPPAYVMSAVNDFLLAEAEKEDVAYATSSPSIVSFPDFTRAIYSFVISIT